MEFQDKINAFLISTTHYFAVSRRADLAIANVLALLSMSTQNKNEKTFLIVNAAVTYSMGYSYFLQHDMMSGVYMFLLGLLCFGTAVSDTLQYILNDWNDRFRIRKEVVYDESESESEEEEDEEGPNPASTERVTPVESESAPVSSGTTEQTTAPVSSGTTEQTTAPVSSGTTEQTTAPEPSVESEIPPVSFTEEQTAPPEPALESQSLAPESSGTTEQAIPPEPASAPIPASEPLTE